jgi:hypothetical protein
LNRTSLYGKAMKKYLTTHIVLLLLSGPNAGCYKSTPCGQPETCNYLDDDCDDLVDEDFKDELGRYSTVDHCGGCGVRCSDVFPTALETECADRDGGFACRIVRCPDGTHRAGTGACVPEVSSLCLPCVVDDDCALYEEGARCVPMDDGAGRCLPPCGMGDSCPAGFFCTGGPEDALCMPLSGTCACTEETAGVGYACLITSPSGDRCAGEQICEMTDTGPALTECEAQFEEICDAMDNDCDGESDEDFIVDGRYVHPDHCGACNEPCVPPGPNMLATCVAGDPPQSGSAWRISWTSTGSWPTDASASTRWARGRRPGSAWMRTATARSMTRACSSS